MFSGAMFSATRPFRPQWTLCAAAIRRLRVKSVVAAVAGTLAGAASGAQLQPIASRTEVTFDIPAQPLADALVAYGAVTGLELFYDAALAEGRRSTAVRGSFVPVEALQTLLRGTGYVPQTTTDRDTVTIVARPHQVSPVETAAQLQRYQPYFARLQARIDEVLCGYDRAKPGDDQVLVSIWLQPSGAIAHAQVRGTSLDPAQRDGMARAMQGLAVGDAIPPGLPQPVTIAIYPPSDREQPGCIASDRRQAGR